MWNLWYTLLGIVLYIVQNGTWEISFQPLKCSIFSIDSEVYFLTHFLAFLSQNLNSHQQSQIDAQKRSGYFGRSSFMRGTRQNSQWLTTGLVAK